MSYTNLVDHGVNANGKAYAQQNSYAASAAIGVEEAIPDSSTDLQINVAIDVSATKFLWMKSDQNITIETNSASVPDNTIALIAGLPYLFERPAAGNPYNAFLLTVDVTAIFVTNASGATANLEIIGVQDATP